jgi:hypothetical protein
MLVAQGKKTIFFKLRQERHVAPLGLLRCFGIRFLATNMTLLRS